MTLETRHACPVCLGVKMEKVSVAHLTLDHCSRCGGVWFGAGEVHQLRQQDAAALWRAIAQRDVDHAMRCHSCRAHIPRAAESCHACGWRVELGCPVCERSMPTSRQDGLTLDYCTHCRGVWFDHDELTGIWKLEVKALAQRRRADAVDTAADVVLLDVLLYDPFLTFYGVHAAGEVVGAAGELLAGAGAVEAVGAVGEVAGAAGEVAASLFETIVEIIGGIFG